MAAGMIYTIGGSFWEFGGPDLERAKLFVMIGTAEDHHSNPLKIAIAKFKRGGGRFISINPVRTGYSAIADEWIPIRPGTDGALFMALLHELIASDLVDHAFLKRYTNAPQLVVLDAGEREGMFAHDPDPAKGPPGDGRHPHNKLVFDTASRTIKAAYPEGIAEGSDPALEGVYALADGTRVAPSFQLLRDRVAPCTPEWAEAITGIGAGAHPEARARARRDGAAAGVRAADRLDRRLGQAPRDDAGAAGRVPRDARPGGAFERLPDGARARGADERARHDRRARRLSPQGAVPAPHRAELSRLQLARHDPAEHAAQRGAARLSRQPRRARDRGRRTPMRIDHAFSWEHPLSAHGLMHTVITNATRGDPYRLDTLMIFMSNMAWNSTMNTVAVREMLNRRNADGEHEIPFLVVCDAFQSETVAFADLVLPDTTYLERHDVMSMLDRPISEFDGPADSVRVPVVAPTGECKPFQDVLVELASRLKLPAFTTAEGGRKFKDYPDFVVNYETQPGIGFLMGWRGTDGDQHLRGAPNPKQWEMYANNDCVFQLPAARDDALHAQLEPRVPRLRQGQGLAPEERRRPARALQRHAADLSPRRAGQDAGPPAARAPARADRDLLRPAAVLVPAARRRRRPTSRRYPLDAITQRPMAMYHSWDSQNAWLRQIHSHNYLHVNPTTARPPASPTAAGAGSRAEWGQVRCMLRYSEAVEPGTVWTWNAIGKADGAWQLAPGADEARKGFLLNHLISDELPNGAAAARSATPIRSPARPAGTTCACASGRPAPTKPRRRRRASPRRQPGPARAHRHNESIAALKVAALAALRDRARAAGERRRPPPRASSRSSRSSSTSTSASAATPA